MSWRPRPRPPADDRSGLGDVGTGSGVGGAGELTADEVAALRADDALLDALGRGEPVTGDDELAAMLGAWRAEMDTEPLPSIDLTGVVPEPDLDGRPYPWADEAGVSDRAGVRDHSRLADGASARSATGRASVGRPAPAHPAATTRPTILRSAATGGAGARPAGGPDGEAHPRPGRARSRRWPRGARLGIALAVALAAVAGLSITADRGGPDGPLWTVVRLVDPAGASLREAQGAVAKAEKAFADRRLDDSQVLVDRAQPLVDRVRDPAERAALQKRLDVLRAALAATGPIPPIEQPNGGRPPGVGTPTPTPGTTTGPGTGGATGGAGPTGGASPGQTGGGGLLGGLAPSSQPPILPTCLLSLPPVHIPPLPPLC
jgi:hypothetical protein